MLLTAKQSLAYELRRRQKKSQTEIALALDISQPAVSQLLKRADARIESLVGRVGREHVDDLLRSELKSRRIPAAG
jgi:predicted transcriptional regulator